jgi:photosystem II stability/assembly factor-like uncharacterized protein
MTKLSKIFSKPIFYRPFMFIFSSITILGVAGSCSLPGVFNGNRTSSIVYGVLKKDPAVKSDGFVRANAVEQLDGSVDGQGLSSLSTIKLQRIDQNRLYALTKEKGLFKTSNAGQVWKRMYVFPVGSNNSDQEVRNQEIGRQIRQNDNLEINDFAVDPNLPDVIYISASQDDVGKIYQSLDNGDNFREVYSEVDDKIQVLFLAVDPVNSLNLFAILEEGALLRSLDGGITWQKIRSFQDTPVQIGFVPEFNGLFFAFFKDDGLAVSRDLGENWEVRSLTKSPSEIGENQPKDGLDISFRDRAEFGSYEKLIAVTAGLNFQNSATNIESWVMVADKQMWYSEIGSTDFKKLILPIQSETANIYDVTPDPQSGLGRIIASVNDRIFITNNRGQSWNTQDNINLSTPIGSVSQILIEPNNTEIVYLGIINAKAVKRNGIFEF